jgi:ammonium transporter Rh
MADIQRATLAGGIALGSVTSYLVSAGAAMVTGAVAGAVSTLGLVYLQPFMQRRLKIEDPLGVTSIYLIPGLIGAIAGILSAGVASDYSSVYGQSLDTLFPQRDDRQAGWNLLVLIITIAISFTSGGFFGLVFEYP